MEKLDLANMTCEQAVKEVARIIHTVHDDVKDKDFVYVSRKYLNNQPTVLLRIILNFAYE